MEIKKKSTILFLGDCITGADRDLNNPNDLGHGYVERINDAIKNYRIRVVNRGVDENRTINLLEQYEENVLKVKPDVVTIYIIDITPELTKMREELWQKVDIIRRLAREYAQEYIALDGSFASACIKHQPTFYSIDGVHPTEEGHKFIARRWLRNIIIED